jgi:hypothetical protein
MKLLNFFLRFVLFLLTSLHINGLPCYGSGNTGNGYCGTTCDTGTLMPDISGNCHSGVLILFYILFNLQFSYFHFPSPFLVYIIYQYAFQDFPIFGLLNVVGLLLHPGLLSASS